MDDDNQQYKKQISTSVISSEVENCSTHFEYIVNVKGVENCGLYRMNKFRVPFIVQSIVGKQKMNELDSLKGYNILEVGCGIGILTMAIAERHAKITSIDPSNIAIGLANRILQKRNSPELENRITYKCTTIEEYSVQDEEMFDAIVISEVLEHVSEKPNFLELALKRLKPGGSIIISTFEKNFLTWITAIVLLQNIYKILPYDFHDWNLFISIAELKLKKGALEKNGLFRMNRIRVPFIAECIVGKHKMNEFDCLKGYNILDIGCGAGLLTTELAKRHAKVTGVDPSEESINIGKNLIDDESDINLKNRITLLCTTVEDLPKDHDGMFDAVILSEVLEHVADVSNLITASLKRLKPGGSVVITTFEKNFLTWIIGVLLSEYVFNCITRGLHDWNLFVPLSDLVNIFGKNRCVIVRTQGFWENFLTGKYETIYPTKIRSYMLHAVKQC